MSQNKYLPLQKWLYNSHDIEKLRQLVWRPYPKRSKRKKKFEN